MKLFFFIENLVLITIKHRLMNQMTEFTKRQILNIPLKINQVNEIRKKKTKHGAWPRYSSPIKSQIDYNAGISLQIWLVSNYCKIDFPGNIKSRGETY